MAENEKPLISDDKLLDKSYRIRYHIVVATRLERLRQRIAQNPKHVRFANLDRLLQGYGFAVRQPRGGSSHYVYSKGPKRLTVPYRRPHLREHYVRAALALLEDEEEESSGEDT